MANRRKRRTLLYEATCLRCACAIYLPLRDWRTWRDPWADIFGPYCEDCAGGDSDVMIGKTRGVKVLTNGRETNVAQLLPA